MYDVNVLTITTYYFYSKNNWCFYFDFPKYYCFADKNISDITLLLLMELVCYFIHLLQLCLRYLILLFPLWVQKSEEPSLDFQSDKVDFSILKLKLSLWKSKEGTLIFWRRVGKELCDYGNTKSNDGWSSSTAQSLVRE